MPQKVKEGSMEAKSFYCLFPSYLAEEEFQRGNCIEGDETEISRFQQTELCYWETERKIKLPNSRISSNQKK